MRGLARSWCLHPHTGRGPRPAAGRSWDSRMQISPWARAAPGTMVRQAPRDQKGVCPTEWELVPTQLRVVQQRILLSGHVRASSVPLPTTSGMSGPDLSFALLVNQRWAYHPRAAAAVRCVSMWCVFVRGLMRSASAARRRYSCYDLKSENRVRWSQDIANQRISQGYTV
jgi:hypothetical protein